MRRKDKQMTKDNALDMLMQSKVISIAINAGEYPYIVPLNYAGEIADGKVSLFVHCAKEGRKIDLLKTNPKIGFEVHTSSGFTNADKSSECSTFYKSVIGTGEVSFVEDNDKKIHALSLLMKSLVNRDVKEFDQNVVDRTTIMMITVNEFEGKASGK